MSWMDPKTFTEKLGVLVKFKMVTKKIETTDRGVALRYIAPDGAYVMTTFYNNDGNIVTIKNFRKLWKLLKELDKKMVAFEEEIKKARKHRRLIKQRQ